jgi:hypothetical protein
MLNSPAARQLNIPRQLNFLAPTVLDDLIRVGRHNDGGYVIPKLIIDKTDILISFGISDDWSFDAQFLSLKPDVEIHAYDHTISRNYFIKKLLGEIRSLFYGRSNFANVCNRVNALTSYPKFFSGNVKHFKEAVHNRKIWKGVATVQDVFDRVERTKKIFVKMDIEANEYRIIPDILTYSKNILGMVIEFHDIDTLRDTFVSCIQKLQNVYEIVHLHANNDAPPAKDSVPEVLEVTFVQKTFCDRTDKRRTLPLNGLDEPNVPSKAEYVLNFDL